MPKYLTETWSLISDAANAWLSNKGSQMGAALAFYSILSIAPLLVLAIAVAALFFGEDAARGELLTQLKGLVGADGATTIQALIANSQLPETGGWASILGLATLLFGASGVFGQMQDSMNTIWDVPPLPGMGIVGSLRRRFLSFAMVFGTGFLLLVSLILSAVIAGLGTYFQGAFPGLVSVWHWVNELVSFALIALLFAMIFKVLPDTDVEWKDVGFGAMVTAALFVWGKWLIGLYLGSSGLGSTYGAAGSLVVLIVWIYYSAQILYFGAELTRAHSRRRTLRLTSAAM